MYPLNPLDNGQHVMLDGKPLRERKFVIKGISNRAKPQDVKDEIEILFPKGTLVAWADTEIESWTKPRYLIVIECINCDPASVPLAKGVKSKRLRELRKLANNVIHHNYRADV